MTKKVGSKEIFALLTKFDCGVIHFYLVTAAAPRWVNLSTRSCIWMTAAENQSASKGCKLQSVCPPVSTEWQLLNRCDKNQ